MQVEIVGRGFTPRGARGHLDHTGQLSYYMKGKSEWAIQPSVGMTQVGLVPDIKEVERRC